MNNSHNIKFVSDEFETNLAALKGKVEEMNQLFADVKSKTSAVSSYWSGNLGSSNLQSFNNFSKIFDEVSLKNKSYMDFLDETCSKYKMMEEMINKAIDDGKDALSINDGNNA